MGPSGSDESINTGVACHIYSAALNGPRGRGGKSNEFIESAENGIWCCDKHASLIDKNQGNDYPAETLFSWKALAEARTKKLLDDVPSPLGWVDKIEYLRFSNHATLPSIKLSRFSLIYSGNVSGKSALLEAAGAISNSLALERFSTSQMHARITYSTVDSFSKDVELIVDNELIKRIENDTPCLLPPGDLEVIYLSERYQYHQEHEDDVDFFMRFLGIDKSTLYALINPGPYDLLSGTIKLDVVWDYDEEIDTDIKLKKPDGTDYIGIYFKRDGVNSEYVNYKNLSKSESSRLILGLMLKKAKAISKQRLTFFIVDGMIYNYDKNNFRKLLEYLTTFDFQVAVVLPYSQETEVLDKTGSAPRLQEHEYLKPWKLISLQQHKL